MELLIVVATLFAAIYAVVPRDRQLNLLLRIGLFDWGLVFITSVLVLYLEFNEFFSSKGWVIPRPWPTGVTPQNTIYLVLTGATAILVVRLRISRLSKNKIQQFRELIEELYWDERYGELFTLLESNLAELFRIAKSSSWQSRLRNRLRRASGNLNTTEMIMLIEEINAKGGPQLNRTDFPTKIRKFVSKVAFNTLQFLPEDRTVTRPEKELIGSTLLSPRFINALVRTRPYFALDIIREWTPSHERAEFINQYISELMRNATSIFYQEIDNNQNLVSSHRYDIPESNRLIYFLLSDANFAHDNGIYKPVGDYALLYLDDLARQPDRDPYNNAPDDIPDPRENQVSHGLCLMPVRIICCSKDVSYYGVLGFS